MSTEMLMVITGVDYGKVEPSVFALPAQIKALVK